MVTTCRINWERNGSHRATWDQRLVRALCPPLPPTSLITSTTSTGHSQCWLGVLSCDITSRHFNPLISRLSWSLYVGKSCSECQHQTERIIMDQLISQNFILRRSSTYHLLISVRNKHGWSDTSKLFTFQTSSSGRDTHTYWISLWPSMMAPANSLTSP